MHFILVFCKGPIPSHPVFDEPPFLVDREKQYVPEAIVDHETTTTRTGMIYTRYLLTFKGHAREDARWMPEKFFRNHSSILTSYKHTLDSSL